MDFKNSFSAGKRTKFPTKATYYFPSHLQYVVALPCKSYKFEFWQIWYCTTSQEGNTCFQFTGSVATEQSWPQVLNPVDYKIWGIVQQRVYQLRLAGAHCTTLMNWSSVCCMFGRKLTKPSLSMQLTSGVSICVHKCGQKTDTLSNYCDNVQPHEKRLFSFCQMWHNFYIFL